ncbi:hypothetical protein COCSUDRAFT_62698 [Coccomyxa subellipsoidea C-169]|uniref:Rad21/Rec8-like protein C-terminal eukaryotic domain-containing protein n=1 Tax=Coccomyxa subellipsoidea (strain C-169) TaxID=574566 RepID=I0Z0L9_COCSC|nr:hypothetical protein COCSUDRAFT_62698 [Coccomyxa subellipsoidea C-169]EIE24188.1 hypothetical protein COCSUDRAFT_62698 [Coccomyxa subellipsoidea C-169]|eukprot:XP_005648732.1 hypothetical protein COCSUDRAFT_62698 [Coccomyxa subellipsoidea C-169]
MEPDIPQSLRLQGILIGTDQPERITLQDINFAGRDEDIYNVKLINEALTDDDMFPAGHAALGDDLFVMPTLDEPGDSYGDAALTNGSSSFAMDLSAPSVPDIDFNAGLNMDQPERFDMLEMDIEMPDVAAELQMQAEAAAQADMHSDKQVDSQGDPIIAPPAPLTPPAPGGEMDMEQMDEYAAGEMMHASPLAGPEVQHAAQAKKKKRHAAAIMDAPEGLLIDRKVYRDWTLFRADLVTERPKRQRLLHGGADAVLVQFSLTIPSQLMCLFKRHLIAGPAASIDKELPSTPPQAARTAQSPRRRAEPQRHLEDDFFEMQIDGLDAQSEDPAYADHYYADEGVQGEAVPDMPTEEELQAMAEEEGLPIEQLRAALETPGSAAAQQLQKQLGLTPSSSKHSGLASILARRSRPGSSTRGRPPSMHSPGFPDSSVEHRLSDVREDTPGLGSFSMDGGNFDDLLQPLPEEDEDLPGPGYLTQFQALGGSLMEATEILQKHFSEAERQEGGPPVLSLFALTSKMNRGQAARIFYQVCVMTSTNFVKATQNKPYDDILLSPGNAPAL